MDSKERCIEQGGDEYFTGFEWNQWNAAIWNICRGERMKRWADRGVSFDFCDADVNLLKIPATCRFLLMLCFRFVLSWREEAAERGRQGPLRFRSFIIFFNLLFLFYFIYLVSALPCLTRRQTRPYT